MMVYEFVHGVLAMTSPDSAPRDAGIPEGQALDAEFLLERAEEAQRLVETGDALSASLLLAQLHPADQGGLLSMLPDAERRVLFGALAPDAAARVLEELDPEDAAAALAHIEPSIRSDILDEVSPEVAADVLHQLSEERAQETLREMEEAEDVIPLLQYPDDTAGGLMAPNFPVVLAHGTAATALDVLRLRTEVSFEFNTVFVVNDEGALVGQVGLISLALARSHMLVRESMDANVISTGVDTDQEECARLMRHYDLAQLPVTDGQGRLVGVIPADYLVEVVVDEDTEDMLQVAAVGGDRVTGPLRRSIRSRLPWLTVNLGTTFLAAVVIGLFQSTIADVVILAAFLPVVAGQGGIGGTQTMTLVVRSIALGELGGVRARQLLTREAVLGLVHGVALGLLVAVVALAWRQNLGLAVVLGIAMLGNMVVAGLVGASVPLLLRRLRLDPAVSSAVVVTTFTDVVGFLLFLGLATALIELLL